MPRKIVFVIAIFLTVSAFGQKKDYLIRFSDTGTPKLSGYKDTNGNVVFPAKLRGYPTADTFYNIISLSEDSSGGYKSYYLLRNGRKIGIDSGFIDNEFMCDCESEGKIRFKDYKKNFVSR